MDLNEHSALVVLFAGVSFFMFGLSIASQALQKLMANRVRELLSHVAKNRFITTGIGMTLTVALQSSGAVTSMLVGLGSAGVIRLPEVMGIILGASIGSTITVQLISFKLAYFGLPTFVVAYSIYFMTKKKLIRRFLSVVMGFGLIFFGIELIGLSTNVIQKIEFLASAFTYLSEYPFVAFFVSVLVTGFVHSSAVVIGFVITLSSAGLISFHDSIYWVLGANVGTTSTALMAAIGGGVVGRQIAWAHFFYRMISALLFFLIVDQFVEAVKMIPGQADIARDIANAHTIFNIVAALIFLPLIGWGAKFIERLFPPRAHEQEFSTKYLQTENFNSPALSIGFAKREVMRMGDIVLSMLKDSMQLFSGDDPEMAREIGERDNRVDLLHHEIKLFLVDSQEDNSDGTSKYVFYTISFANDLESAADVIDNGIVELARKKQDLKLEFSESGWEEILELHELATKLCTLSLAAFQAEDPEMAKQVVNLKRVIRKREKGLKESHIERLTQGTRESINTSSIHLDLLGDLLRIVGLMSNHCYSLQKRG